MLGMPKLRGMGASRKGSPAIGLQTIIDRLQGRPPTRHKVSADVSLDDAAEAASILERGRGSARRFRDASIIGGAMSPLVRGVGRAAEAAVMAPRGQRMRSAIHGVQDGAGLKDIKGMLGTNRGEIVKHVFEGGLGGAAVNASREGAEIGRAKRKAKAFLEDKTAAVLPVGKQKFLLSAADVWGHNTIAARNAASVAGTAGADAVHNTMVHAPTMAPGIRNTMAHAPTIAPGQQGIGNARTIMAGGRTIPPRAAPVAAAPVAAVQPRARGRLRPGVGIAAAGVGLTGAGMLAAGGDPQQKLASGLNRSLSNMAAKIQPVRTSKLQPIIDPDIDYEV